MKFVKVELQGFDGGFVAHKMIPPFNELPGVVLWGQRYFKLYAQPESDLFKAVYRECFTYAIPNHRMSEPPKND